MTTTIRSEKPVVRYREEVFTHIDIGLRAMVVPLDHPNHGLPHSIRNGMPAWTSTVIAHNKDTGAFETLNTLYVREAV